MRWTRPSLLVNDPSDSAQAAMGNTTLAASTSGPLCDASSTSAAGVAAGTARLSLPSTSTVLSTPVARSEVRSLSVRSGGGTRRSTPVVLGFLSALTRIVSDQPRRRPPAYTRSILSPSSARRSRAWLSSLVHWNENTTPTLPGERARSSRSVRAASSSATSKATRLPPAVGRSTRPSCTALYSKRPSSHIQCLLTAGFSRGTRRRILPREA